MTSLTDYRQPGNPLDERTEVLDLPLPHWLNDSHDDVLRLRSALLLLDAAHKLLADGKADQTALQALTRQTGADFVAQEEYFTRTLANALLGVDQQIQALNQAMVAKRVDLQAVATASTSEQAKAGEVAIRRLRQGHINTVNTPTGTLEAGVEYSVFAEAWAEGWTLPAEPGIGDQIVMLDSWNTWHLRTFRVKRGKAAHFINGLQEDVQFNVAAWRVTFTYVWANRWTLSIG